MRCTFVATFGDHLYLVVLPSGQSSNFQQCSDRPHSRCPTTLTPININPLSVVESLCGSTIESICALGRRFEAKVCLHSTLANFSVVVKFADFRNSLPCSGLSNTQLPCTVDGKWGVVREISRPPLPQSKSQPCSICLREDNWRQRWRPSQNQPYPFRL